MPLERVEPHHPCLMEWLYQESSTTAKLTFHVMKGQEEQEQVPKKVRDKKESADKNASSENSASEKTAKKNSQEKGLSQEKTP